ncbi:MAG: tRNA pseudouridine(55) synthase TruB [Chloroflexota bacterium]|nr:tRNA pseudouridine(55) synthase TruB [Chloroflexota bacterium]MDE2894941.1 tRNA pseudouridine(55) synthase TruB [Chloroflexota bacterium]
MSRRRRERHHPGAVFLVDKPKGPTSHDIVRDVRRWTGLRRVGHGGTLDPLASGLLPVFVGVATRLNEYLAPYRKSYEATVLLGQSTDTDDSEGQIIETAEVPAISEQELDAVLDRFRGEIEQVPPQYSAVKRDGVAAYRAARAGEHVEIEARAVTVHELTATSLALPYVTLVMSVSTGTYVRAIARDLGQALGCGAHVTKMRRTAIGAKSAEDGHSPDELQAAADEDEIWSLAISPAELFPDWPHFHLQGEQLQRIKRGQPIRHAPVDGWDKALALTADNRVAAVLRRDELSAATWQPEKVLAAG